MVTGDIFKGLIFDGIDSKQYGIYITGEAVFNAPSRDVEMIDIPGRNGSYALDKGRFNNISVTYPAGTFADSEPAFAQGVSDFRNALASRRGYCRLTDDYNPDEYRMAVYEGGLEVAPSQLKAGEFEITFNCKPQRFLTSGEAEQNVTSGATINNPTLFDSRPLFAVYGYGQFNVNDEKVTVYNAALGDINLNPISSDFRVVYNGRSATTTELYTIETAFLNTGDAFTWSGGKYTAPFDTRNKEYYNTRNIIGTPTPGMYTTPYVAGMVGDEADSYWDTRVYYVGINITSFGFTYGTSAIVSDTSSISVNYTTDGGNTYTDAISITLTASYDGADKITLSIAFTSNDTDATMYWDRKHYVTKEPTIKGVSTWLPSHIYIDTDIGEAYFMSDGVVTSANEYIYFNNAELPTLKPGSNTITYASTITSFKLIARWWKI